MYKITENLNKIFCFIFLFKYMQKLRNFNKLNTKIKYKKIIKK